MTPVKSFKHRPSKFIQCNLAVNSKKITALACQMRAKCQTDSDALPFYNPTLKKNCRNFFFHLQRDTFSTSYKTVSNEKKNFGSKQHM